MLVLFRCRTFRSANSIARATKQKPRKGLFLIYNKQLAAGYKYFVNTGGSSGYFSLALNGHSIWVLGLAPRATKTLAYCLSGMGNIKEIKE